MLKGIYTTAAGMLPKTLKLDYVANNLANISTPGYKRDEMFMEELKSHFLFQENGTIEQPTFAEKQLTDFSQGSLQPTGNPLDLAINGEGFFQVETSEGLKLTRDGHFKLDKDNRLVNSSGDPVMGSSGEIIIDGSVVDISGDGKIYVDGEFNQEIILFTAKDPKKLSKSGSNTWESAAENLEQLRSGEVAIQQHHLESSNVSGMREIQSLIELQRSFETDQKLIRIQDESLTKLIQVGGR